MVLLIILFIILEVDKKTLNILNFILSFKNLETIQKTWINKKKVCQPCVLSNVLVEHEHTQGTRETHDLLKF